MQTKTRNALISNYYTHISIVHILKSYTSYSLIRESDISSTCPPNSEREGTELFLSYSNHYLSAELLLHNQCNYTEYQIKQSPASCFKLLTCVSWLA